MAAQLRRSCNKSARLLEKFKRAPPPPRETHHLLFILGIVYHQHAELLDDEGNLVYEVYPGTYIQFGIQPVFLSNLYQLVLFYLFYQLSLKLN